MHSAGNAGRLGRPWMRRAAWSVAVLSTAFAAPANAGFTLRTVSATFTVDVTDGDGRTAVFSSQPYYSIITVYSAGPSSGTMFLPAHSLTATPTITNTIFFTPPASGAQIQDFTVQSFGNLAATLSFGGGLAGESPCPGGPTALGRACVVGGGFGGPMALFGVLQFRVIPGVLEFPLDLGALNFGVGGAVTSPDSADAAPWTTKTGYVLSSGSASLTTVGGASTVPGPEMSLVSPTYVTKLGYDLLFRTRLDLQFVDGPLPSFLDSPQCNDGVDQDGDGLTDLLDPDCQDALDDAEWHLEPGDLVVTNPVWLNGTGAVVRVDAAGTHVTTLYGGAPLVTPYALGLGRDGEIWFTDIGTNQLLRLDPNDGQLTVASSDPQIANGRSLAVDRSGDVFIGTQTVHGILRIRTVTGLGVGQISFVTQNNAIFDYPVDLQLSKDGTTLYLVDRTNVQDIVIETDLSNPGQHAVNSTTIVNFAGLAANPQPRGIALTGAGDLLAVESETKQLYEIGLPVGSPPVGPGPGLLTGGVLSVPADVIEEPDGDRILIDPGLHGLYRVPAGGSLPSLFFTAPEIADQVLMIRIAEACSNGFDDDGDGFVDFPDDPECASATQTTELPEPGVASGLAAGLLLLHALARRRQRQEGRR